VHDLSGSVVGGCHVDGERFHTCGWLCRLQVFATILAMITKEVKRHAACAHCSRPVPQHASSNSCLQVFATILAMITEEVNSMLLDVSSGKAPLAMTGHILLLNWNQQVCSLQECACTCRKPEGVLYCIPGSTSAPAQQHVGEEHGVMGKAAALTGHILLLNWSRQMHSKLHCHTHTPCFTYSGVVCKHNAHSSNNSNFVNNTRIKRCNARVLVGPLRSR
jgi:hypothetical protein